MLAHFAGLFMFRSDYCAANLATLCIGVVLLYIADPQRPHEKWQTLVRDRETEKHARYATHTDGRRCSNMKSYTLQW